MLPRNSIFRIIEKVYRNNAVDRMSSRALYCFFRFAYSLRWFEVDYGSIWYILSIYFKELNYDH